MTATSPSRASAALPPTQADLRARIGWMCHVMRIAFVLWAGWILVLLGRGWYTIDRAKLVDGINRLVAGDVTEISAAQVAVVEAGLIGVWVLEAVLAWCVWRLCAVYLQGRIFTVEAAVWLRHIGTAGLAALICAIVWRKVILFIYTIHGHVPAMTVLASPPLLLTPGDLLRGLFCVFVLALAFIFKAAAELADDHAGIV